MTARTVPGHARAPDRRIPRTEELPVATIAARRRERPQRRFPVEVLDPREVQALLDACAGHGVTDIRNRALIALLYRSGLRINEALSLHPKDIDPARGSVRVLNGKGARPARRV